MAAHALMNDPRVGQRCPKVDLYYRIQERLCQTEVRELFPSVDSAKVKQITIDPISKMS